MDIQEKLNHLPTQPGVYLMKSQTDEIIYVGKAVNLRNRVRSYFQVSRHHSPKTKLLAAEVADIEYIVTDSEVEALILESNLIKQHSPWFNVRLKDDKNYPFIKVTVNEEFPRVFLVRRRLSDGARYFGPYTSTSAVRSTLKFLRKLFPIRTCRNAIKVGSKDRPCLNYHIGRCQAPCVGLIDEESYNKIVDEVCLFLEGRHDCLIPNLKLKMQEASETLQFEQAAVLRDRISALEQIVEKQKIVAASNVEQDILGYARAGDLVCVQVFFVRSGKLIGREHFMLECNVNEDESEIITAFVKQYYHDNGVIPKEILTRAALEEEDIISRWLRGLRGNKVYLRHPQRGSKKALVEMANENAELVLAEMHAEEERRANEIERGLWELKDALKLSKPIRRIEAYDVSNIQGNYTVASMVVMIEGEAANDQYRRFKIASVEDGPNDYLAMQEVIHRRFSRGLREIAGEVEGDKFSDLPDLVVIDGGKGQLSSAIAVKEQLGLDIPFISLAEKFEEIYLENRSEPLILPRESQGLYLLQRIRDEAHRFAVSYHRYLRSKESTRSVLDQIPGIGPKRKKALIKHFGSVSRICEAGMEELVEVEGINRKLAAEIYQYIHK